MKIPIGVAIDRLEDLKFSHTQDGWEYGRLTEDCSLDIEALQLAVDIMHKYQRIKLIITNNGYSCDELILMHIKEVIEDGNDE